MGGGLGFSLAPKSIAYGRRRIEFSSKRDVRNPIPPSVHLSMSHIYRSVSDWRSLGTIRTFLISIEFRAARTAKRIPVENVDGIED